MITIEPTVDQQVIRPAGWSDSDDDSDFSLMEPINPYYRITYQPQISHKERFQSIVIQGKYNEFEKMIQEDFNNTIDYRFNNGWTPLMYACYHGQPRMVEYLLDRGADPNAHADSVTPMMLLCTNGFGTDEELRGIAEKLVEKGCIINLGDKQGMTPLMRSIECGRKDLVEFMIENNGNIEMRDRQGWTAIFWAVHCKQTQVLDRLIELGARITEVDRINRTLLDIAESHDNKDMINTLGKYFTMRNVQDIAYVNADPDYWLEYYPGLRTNHKQLYKDEIVNLLYAMNCDHLRPNILRAGLDLRTFLLLEERDMMKLGIELQFERQRLKKGLRAFHTRNWNLKSVSGLYASQMERFGLLECLESVGTSVMQMYILEASLQYAAREANRYRRHVKFEPPDDSIIKQIGETVNNMLANINKIRKEVDDMNRRIQTIRDNSPQPVQIFEEPGPFKSSLQASAVGVTTFGLVYLVYCGVVRCVSSLTK